MPTQSSVTVQVIAIVVDRQLVGFSFEGEFCTADPFAFGATTAP